MADFRQIISLGRKRIGILAGAGLPVSIRVNSQNVLDDNGQPLILDVTRLTNKVVDSFSAIELGALQAIRNECGPKANIEDILSRIRLLERALGKVVVNGLDGDGYRKLGQSVCDQIGEHVKASLPQGRSAYTELISWIGGTARQHPVEIFTTNYDLLFEEACERARISYFDGFTGGNAPFFDPVTVAGDDLPARWMRLWKLHGSLGWSEENKAVVRKGGKSATQLIYPDHLKYDLIQKQPYSALLDRLKQFLATPDTLLLATGFSFADRHICTVIEEGLAFNSNAAVFAFQYRPLALEDSACALAFNRPNFSVYAEDGAVIRGVAGSWRVGQLPEKGWEEIRSTFWASRKDGEAPIFTLGDSTNFARFCALAQATDVQKQKSESTQEGPNPSSSPSPSLDTP